MRAVRPVASLLAALLFLTPLVLMVTGSLRKAGLPPPRGPEGWWGGVRGSRFPRVYLSDVAAR
jgi:hypothetical protein